MQRREQGTAQAEDDRQAGLAQQEGEPRAQAWDGPGEAQLENPHHSTRKTPRPWKAGVFRFAVLASLAPAARRLLRAARGGLPPRGGLSRCFLLAADRLLGGRLLAGGGLSRGLLRGSLL